MKKTSKIVSLAMCLCALASCSTTKDPEFLTVVAGFSIDGSPGAYSTTVEIVQATSNQPENRSILVSGTGITLVDALQNSAMTASRDLYYNHAQVAVLGREVAEEGIGDLLEAIMQNNNLCLNMRLVIAEKRGDEIMVAQPLINEVRSLELRQTMELNSEIAKAPDMVFYKFYADILEPGIEGILPFVDIKDSGEGQPTQQVGGTALFKGDRMIVTIDPDKTPFLLWLRGEQAVSSVAVMPGISVNVQQNSQSISIEDEKTVKISLDFAVTIEEGTEKQEQMLSIIEGQFEQSVDNVIDILQEFDCDSIGIGRAIYRLDPEMYERVKSPSDGIPNVEIKTEISVKITSYGNYALHSE